MEVLAHIKLPATLDNLPVFIDLVAQKAEEYGFGRKYINEIELALEEALVNVAKYAYGEAGGDVEVNCRSFEGGVFSVEIIDSGVPFDLTTMPDPDIAADISDRKIGGLGIFFIRQLMDEVVYQRQEDKNILTMNMKIKIEGS